MTKKEFNKHKNKVGRIEDITDEVIQYIIENENHVFIFDYDLSNEYRAQLEAAGFKLKWLDCRSFDLPDTYEIKKLDN